MIPDKHPDDISDLAPITVAESWQGVVRADMARKIRQQRYLEGVLTALAVLPCTEQAAHG